MRHGLTPLAAALLMGLFATSLQAKTYYVAPNGNDGNSGASAGSPLNTFDHAIRQLTPGDTLILNDGEYTPDNSGNFFARGNGHNAVSGTANAPITVKAAHERQAHIQGDGFVPFRVFDVNHWNVDGLHVSNKDKDGENNGNVMQFNRDKYLNVHRVVADHNNRYNNSGPISVNLSQHVLVDESEIYYYHRNGFSAFRSNDVTFRRNYANSRGYSDLPDGYGSHGISPNGGDGAFVSYYSNNVTVENSVSENHNEGFDDISGRNDVNGNISGQNFKVLGSISLNDYRPGSVGTRKKPTQYGGTGKFQVIHDPLFKNVLVIGAKSKGFTTRSVKGETLENFTFLNNDGPQAFNANTNHQEIPSNGNPRTIWPSNEEIDGASYRLRNWLVINQDGQVLTNVEDNGQDMDFLLEYSNLTDTPSGKSEDITDDAGQIQNSIRQAVSRIGLDPGQVVIYVPDDSPMKGAGKDGADIGANILYRYVDGELTDQLLWDPETGEFPHGAIIDGLNDVAGESVFDLNQRLNVTPGILPVPEPGSLALLGLGGALLLGRRRRRHGRV